MGKSGKKQKHPQRHQRLPFPGADDDGGDILPSSAYNIPSSSPPDDQQESKSNAGGQGDEENGDRYGGGEEGLPSKFHLYQRSVQSPRGDISYLQKFFLMYVGGRLPLHLQEDFCGTALLSSEWLRGDPRRTAVGLDLDLEALDWCLENNLTKIGADGYSRMFLFHGNVLQPREACLVKHTVQDLMKSVDLSDQVGCSETVKLTVGSDSTSSSVKEGALPVRDIVCAFNYSCCCLQRRTDLVLYFKHTFHALSKRGGIFVMDLYGGTSSERKLRLQRRFSDFTYVWEQEDFDIINRRTRISLHFHLGKKHILRHAFSYDWHLWSLPEIKDCLEEAGFQSVHFWIQAMPNTQDSGNMEEYIVGRDVKYEEFSSFEQRDAWNAYIVGVANL